jgi:hypothetical protein
VIAAAKLRCDFDADGKTDLAIGVPGDNNRRGAVNVQYSPAGLLELGAYFRRGLNLPGAAASGQRAGSALACGDFDGDGFADLAVGVPGEASERGAVVVVYGSAAGLFNKFNTYFTQDTIGLDSVAPAEPEDRFGETLAAGDFNDDGRDDLAVGAPGEDGAVVNAAGQPLDYVEDMGAVYILFGITSGLTGPAQSFVPLTEGSCCVPAEEAHYGAALAPGDFDADGVADLAIGAPMAAVIVDDEAIEGAGSVHILRGKANVGLVLDGQRMLTEGSFTTLTSPRPSEYFGLALAVGQFDGRRGDDLAIGAPFEKFGNDVPDYDGYGAVYVANFSGANLAFAPQVFDDSSPPGDGFGERERFGWSLAAGNFDGEHHDDLAIGIPRNVASSGSGKGVSGAVAVLFSDGTQLSSKGAQFFHPGDVKDAVQTPPPPEGTEILFGAALAAGDYQGDGVADLFIGVPALTLAFDNQGGVETRPGVQGAGFDASYMLLTQDTWQPGQTWHAAASNLGFDTDIPGEFSTLFLFTGERMGHALAR